MESTPRISKKAVAIGLAVDYLGGAVVSVVIGAVAGISLAASGARPDTIADRLMASTSVRLLSLVMGLLFTALGGYVAARLAGEGELKHALWVGILDLAILALLLPFGPKGSMALDVASFLLLIPAALLGGKLRLIQAG